ncbi:MAG: mannosyl-3-phosphoglycerate phosphatase family protein [Porticoccus sp.]|jgi:mannosyl-3-phosphoglycerate phosphatase family protein
MDELNTKPMNGNNSLAIIFTDLDGSLLDHNSYQFGPAHPLLGALEGIGIPVIPTSSKTCAEIVALRKLLTNRHPFISENGAASFIPKNYFTAPIAGSSLLNGFHCLSDCPPRQKWLSLLAALQADFPNQFTYFFAQGSAGIEQLTGLNDEDAALANQRDYSEPVKWLGSKQQEQQFFAAISSNGGVTQQGGRFITVSGDCSKGRALKLVTQLYQDQYPNKQIITIAIGDSGNDVSMLEAADYALLIRSPLHDFPEMARSDKLLKSNLLGPAGWDEGVRTILQQLNISL